MKRLLALTLALLCALTLTATAETAAPTFEFRGMTWASSPNDVFVAEGYDAVQSNTVGSVQTMAVYNVTFSKFSGMALYAFTNGKLALTGYLLISDSSSDNDAAYLQSAMSQKYGEPTVFDVQRMTDCISSLGGDASGLSDLAAAGCNPCGWELTDGTLMMLLSVSGYGSLLLYLNEPLLTGGQQPANGGYDLTGL